MMKTGDLIAWTAIVFQLGLLQACGGRGLSAADANGLATKADAAVTGSGGNSGTGGSPSAGGASGAGGVSSATGGAGGVGANPGTGGQSVVGGGGGGPRGSGGSASGGTQAGGAGGGSGDKPATGGGGGSTSDGSVTTGGAGGPGSGGAAGHTGGGSGTALTGGAGGSGSGGRSGSGGTSVPAGTGGTAGTTERGTGGASTGGVSGSGGTATGGTTAGGIGGTVTLSTGSCTTPCGLKLGTTPLPGSSATSQGALLYFNIDTGVATLKDAPDASGTAGQIILGFEFESATNSTSLDHGYSMYSQGNNLWSEWVEPYEYDTKVGPYSIAQFVPMTEELVDVQSNKLIVVKFYLADRGVVIQSIGVPSCTVGSGSCQTSNTCPVVNSGAAGASATTCDTSCSGSSSCAAQCVADASGLPVACADCYARFAACTRTQCTGQYECPTPRLAGNGCLRCQVDKGCHHDFMACSGLDYMPLGTFLLPLPNP